MTREYVLKPAGHHRALQIDYAAQLNPQQLAAVQAPPGPALVIAGAGSGKTRTLTYRVAWLIEHGVPPDRILLMTFTNKAAREMLHRVETLLGGDVAGLWGGTFHHVGNRVLRRHATLLGYRNDFSILDREDAGDLANACINDAKIDTTKERFPKGDVLVEVFSMAVNTERPLGDVLAEQYPYFEQFKETIASLQKRYHERKLKTNAMDYDDLLLNWLRLMREHPDVRDLYQQRFQHVLVDEYQDTNTIQAELIDRLAHAHRNVMVVGDDSQSIFSWRGANFRNIISFPDRYPGAQVYKIEANYRSVPQILRVANEAIRANVNQFPKTLQAIRRSGARPWLVVAGDDNQQAQYVGQRILELRDEGYRLNDIAVLYRSHFHCMEVQMELKRRNIPFLVTSGLRFFEQAHIKDVAAYLRFAINPGDELAFKRLTQLLPGIGGKTADKLWNALLGGKTLKALTATVPAKAKSAWEQAVATVEELREEEVRNRPAEMIRRVIECGYDDYLKQQYTNYSARLDDLAQLQLYAQRFQTTDQFLSDLSLMTNLEVEDETAPKQEDEEYLRLSTVHQAKGQEWGAVFVISLADGMFPSGKALDNIEGEEEERRLFYVAVTRAKDELYLSYPLLRRTSGGSDALQKPSRFLAEIPAGLMETLRLRDSFGSF
ncbi:MAG: ATP-dependent helicase [Verrucomicrobia bacterium]|nr:ATP-dependent helicase [Verrucomicrobiota bacterium]